MGLESFSKEIINLKFERLEGITHLKNGLPCQGPDTGMSLARSRDRKLAREIGADKDRVKERRLGKKATFRLCRVLQGIWILF